MAIIDNIISLLGRSRARSNAAPSREVTPPSDTAQETAPAPPPPLFCSDRIFYQSGYRNQDPGWYFMARGGSARGPYPSRGLARAHLKTFIAHCLETRDTGGREGGHTA